MNETLYEILTRGTDKEIDAVVYCRERMTQSATRICTRILTHHFRPPESEGRLVEITSYKSGDFSMLIVLPSWKTNVESNYLPLIVKTNREQLVVAGVMMPFNDLTPHLNESDAPIGELTAEWIVRKTKSQ